MSPALRALDQEIRSKAKYENKRCPQGSYHQRITSESRSCSDTTRLVSEGLGGHSAPRPQRPEGFTQQAWDSTGWKGRGPLRRGRFPTCGRTLSARGPLLFQQGLL